MSVSFARGLVFISLACCSGTATPDLASAAGDLSVLVSQIAPDARAHPDEPGFAEHLALTPRSGAEGHALVLRLASPGYEPLFRGERRSWGLSVELPRARGWVFAYSYLDESRPADIWHYDPRKRQMFRYQAPISNAALPEERMRAALDAAGVSLSFAITSGTAGYLPASDRVRRALDIGWQTRCR